MKSTCGIVAKLPNLVECDHILQDKTEIPTPATTKHFPHLREISNEIPQLDQDAKISVLIGRDAPELLKVRAFKSGPKGAPWVQKLTLGWTVSGQMCLDRVGGPVHICANFTALQTSTAVPEIESEIQRQDAPTSARKPFQNFEQYLVRIILKCKKKLMDVLRSQKATFSKPSQRTMTPVCHEKTISSFKSWKREFTKMNLAIGRCPYLSVPRK